MLGFVLEWPYSVLLSSIYIKNSTVLGPSLVVLWLRICLPNAGDMGSIPHAVGQRSRWATTAAALLPTACAPQQRPPQGEATQWRAAPARRGWRKPTRSDGDLVRPKKSKYNFLKTALCFWNFPDSPVIKTLCFQSRGHEFDPWPVD